MNPLAAVLILVGMLFTLVATLVIATGSGEWAWLLLLLLLFETDVTWKGDRG